MPFASTEEFLDYIPEHWQTMPNPTQAPAKHARRVNLIGKAKYYCSHCDNSWTSSKSPVVFCVWKSKQQNGMVYVRDFGQQCKYCVHMGTFEPPEWYEDEKERLVACLIDILENRLQHRPQVITLTYNTP